AYLPVPASLNDAYALVTDPTSLKAVLTIPHYQNLLARDERAKAEPFGLAAGIDAKKLDKTGWGVIFPADAPAELIVSLRPLLDHRKTQAGQTKAEFYKEFMGPTGYRPNDTKATFLKRLGRGVGQPADPRRGVPYYLLLVGAPTQIPWPFQYDLDVEYA